MPRHLCVEVVEDLHHGDRFLRDTLDVGGRRTGAAHLRAPTAVAYVPAARIVHPASATGGPVGVRAEQRHVFAVKSERGAMHVVALVGATAHARMWPPLLDWLGHLPE